MNLGCRVLASTRKALTLIPQFHNKIPNFEQPFCTYESNSTNLIQNLIKNPISSTKSLLDSEENHTLKSFGFSWHSFVSTLYSSSASKAHLALEWRLEKMLKDNERDKESYSEMISLCGKTHNLDLAMRVFLAMESIGVKPTSDVLNSLIMTALLVDNEMTALSLFEIMERSEDLKPNFRTYNAFISMYSKLGNTKAMEAWASAKIAAGFTADLQAYDFLISGYVKAGSYDTAERYFEEMITSGIVPGAGILDRMVDGLCESRNLNRLKEFIQYMLDNRWAITAHMANRIVDLYLDVDKLEDIEELLQVLTLSEQDPEVLSVVHCGIIRMHARADRLDCVEYEVGRMLKRGISFRSADDVKVIICSYFRQAAYDRLEVFLEHIKGHYQFTKATCDLLISGYLNAGLSEKLDPLLKDMSLFSS